MEPARPNPYTLNGPDFEPDMLLPSQLPKAGAPLSAGERRLMLAILKDAIYASTSECAPTQKEAREWCRAVDQGLITFAFACEHLGLDPAAMREGLERLWATGQRIRRSPLNDDMEDLRNERSRETHNTAAGREANRLARLRVLHRQRAA